MANANEILDFWFSELTPKQWFSKDDTVDKTIADRYSALLSTATQCELFSWRVKPEGRLAEIIVLDQFSRNLYRDSPAAFAQDPLALALSQAGIAAGADDALSPIQRAFFYMPFMHSESLLIQQQSLQLFERTPEDNLRFAKRHFEIIERFGRYPHRNAVLGRDNTPAEAAFLKTPGSGF